MRIKKGDTVQILSGNDKGKTGEVLEVIPKADKIVEVAIPSAKANVVCPKCGKTTKVGYSEEKSVKVRVCKKCGAKLK